jgi:phosphoenolpyruvate-protein phosphotransferase (PTS system enzyme I)
LSLVRDGISASPGIVIGRTHVLRWDVPRIERTTIREDEVRSEVERFEEARHWTKARIREIQADTAARLGAVESQIFEPQIVMLDDQDLINGTLSYIRENHLSAARAFELRILEFQAEWRRTGHPMVMDRLNDLLDVQLRVVHRLLGLPDPGLELLRLDRNVVLVARELTPTLTVQLDHTHIVGIAMDGGTRTSHSAILARSLGMPAVVSLGDLSDHVENGQEMILDGRAGRVNVEPSDAEKDL